MDRIVEVYTGAYASGKSEISINRAIMLSKIHNPVTLVDLDTVEPAYTLRPIKSELEKTGITVVTQESYFGLGEAGNVITAEQMNCLYREGTIVIDVGYGVGGLDILEVINSIDKEMQLNIYIVINTSKVETSTPENIVEYIKWTQGSGEQAWKKFAGIISNTHFAEQTTKEDIIKGFRITEKASKELNIPIFALCVSENIYPEFEGESFEGVQLWSLKRYMPKALW